MRAVEKVAAQLGNTPAVCRKAYIHPAVLERYLDGSLPKLLKQGTQQESKRSSGRLQPCEAAVLTALQQCVKEAGKGVSPQTQRQ